MCGFSSCVCADNTLFLASISSLTSRCPPPVLLDDRLIKCAPVIPPFLISKSTFVSVRRQTSLESTQLWDNGLQTFFHWIDSLQLALTLPAPGLEKASQGHELKLKLQNRAYLNKNTFKVCGTSYSYRLRVTQSRRKPRCNETVAWTFTGILWASIAKKRIQRLLCGYFVMQCNAAYNTQCHANYTANRGGRMFMFSPLWQMCWQKAFKKPFFPPIGGVTSSRSHLRSHSDTIACVTHLYGHSTLSLVGTIAAFLKRWTSVWCHAHASLSQHSESSW